MDKIAANPIYEGLQRFFNVIRISTPNSSRPAQLKEMGGYEMGKMVQRYAHLAPEHLSQHARLIDSNISAGIGLVQNFAKVENRQSSEHQTMKIN
ncbi:hypothetical protein [Neisseria elongata]|uniref:hypothetical protein n=1 Tax=Neisseria elongata TaxID=495 RepID=UPI00131BC86D|nr:hypothetical protein [Neisseria elongata]